MVDPVKDEEYKLAVDRIVDQFKSLNETALELGTILRKFQKGQYKEPIGEASQLDDFEKAVEDFMLGVEQLRDYEDEVSSNTMLGAEIEEEVAVMTEDDEDLKRFFQMGVDD